MKKIFLALLLLFGACAARSIPSTDFSQVTKRPLGFPSTCLRSKKILFAAVGPSRIALDQLADRYRRDFRVDAEIMEPFARVDAAFDMTRKQARAADVIAAIPKPAPGAFLFLVTDEDIYRTDIDWKFAFSSYTSDVALVSTARMNPLFFGQSQDNDLTLIRLHKIVTRVMGTVYCGLSRSGSPNSMMRPEVLSLEDLDAMDETIW